MSPSENLDNPPIVRRVVVVAPSMPPVHGQAMVSRRVAEIVEERGHDVEWVSRNTPTLGSGVRYRVAVATRVVRALACALRLRSGPSKTVYVGSSGGLGVIAEGLVVALTKRRRDRLVVHHHSFAYLNRRSVVWQVLVGTVYRSAVHVLLCDCMSQRFGSMYGVTADKLRVVGNAAFVDAPQGGIKKPPGAGRMQLGHLSNLSVEKGLDVVLASLALEGCDVSLSVYGSPTGQREVAMLRSAATRYGDRFDVVAPTDRAGVWEYLSSIDIFLFPSKYVNEAAPLVVLESLAAGVPVLVSDVGCLEDMLKPHLSEFVASLAEWNGCLRSIIERTDDPGFRSGLLEMARSQWEHLSTQAADQLATLREMLLAD